MTHSSEIQDISNRPILVADDDHITRLCINEMLRQAGYTADSVANGQEAMHALESRQYDLLILDCNMPVMDGFATARCIRSTTSTRIQSRIPIIALTGLASESDQTRCLEAGMDAVISKPVDSRTLISTIEHCLGNTAAEDPVSQQDDRQASDYQTDAFLDTLIANFLAEVPQTISALQRAVRQEDIAGLMNLGHRLRGATGILKIPTVSLQSAALENAGKAGNLALASRLAAELVEELRKLAAALDE